MKAVQEKALAEWGMSEFDLINALYNFGHFFSSEALAITLITASDLHSLTLEHPVVKAAVRSYQRWFAPDLDRLTMRGTQYGGLARPSIADGEVGENSVLLLTMPRCGCADFRHPNAASEEANWPEACRNDITTSYRMSLSGISEQQLQQIWVTGDKMWEDAIECKFRLLPADQYGTTRIYAFAAALGGSVLADQYLARNDCSVRLQGRFSSSRQWTPQLLQATLVHEHGHALGLNHLQNNNATMYPSIHQASLDRWGRPVEADIAACVALGYRRRTSTPPPPPPDGGRLVATLSENDTRCTVSLVPRAA